MPEEFPILEFDSTREAIIEPSRVFHPIDIPAHCVMCFFQKVIDKLAAAPHVRVVTELKTGMGPLPVYEVERGGKKAAVLHPGTGAPLAGAHLEEMIALGARKFIAVGSCGVLDSTLAHGHVVVPTTAVRDEGTSYHYLPPSRTAAASPEGVKAIEATLKAHRCAYVVGKTWTIDAVFRETRDLVRRRKEEGCIAVEMEAAALFAVAEFRAVTLGQILRGGDDVSGQEWDPGDGSSRGPSSQKLFELAVEAVLRL